MINSKLTTVIAALLILCCILRMGTAQDNSELNSPIEPSLFTLLPVDRKEPISKEDVMDVIFPNLSEEELAHYLGGLGRDEYLVTHDRNESLLEYITKRSVDLEIFPIDLIIDYSQLDYYYYEIRKDGAFSDGSEFIRVGYYISEKIPTYKTDENGNIERIAPFPNSFMCVDDTTERKYVAPGRFTIESLNGAMEIRYDITFERYVPFYHFCQRCKHATYSEIDECFQNFDSLSSREKALLMAAFYIFEQRNRQPSKEKLARYKGRALKYEPVVDTNQVIPDEKWNEWLSRLIEYEKSETVAFEAIPSDGLIEEWERSFRLNALRFQYQLSLFNPYFQPFYGSDYWYSVCRLTPIGFLYAVLLNETDESFLKSNKEYARKSAGRRTLNVGEGSANPSIYANLVRRNDGEELTQEFLDENNVRCDALPLYLSTMPFSETFDISNIYSQSDRTRGKLLFLLPRFGLKRGQEDPYRKALYPDNIYPRVKVEDVNRALSLMREYLLTQFSFSRRYVFHYDIYVHEHISPEVLVDVNESVMQRGKRDRPCCGNTSFEPKTLGFIATTFLRARMLFDNEAKEMY